MTARDQLGCLIENHYQFGRKHPLVSVGKGDQDTGVRQ